MKIQYAIALSLLLLGLVSCEPKERAVWSPDGSAAAVVIGHEVHFANESGNLTSSLAEDDADPGLLLAEKVAWSSDGGSLVIHRIRLASRWEDLKQLLPAAETERVEALAAAMPKFLRSAVVLHGDADRIDQLLAGISGGENEMLLNAVRLALVENRAAVEESLTDAPKAWQSLAGKPDEAKGFFLHELAIARRDEEDEWKVTGIFGRSLRGIAAMQFSPVFPVIAVGRLRGEKGHDVEWIGLDGASRGTVATGTSAAFSWTPDGRGLVNLAPVGAGQGPLVRVLRHDLFDAKGEPLPTGHGESDRTQSKELALAIVPFAPRLAMLPGGDVLFAGQPGSLPMRGGEPVRQPRLYLVASEGGEVREVPTEEGALPMDLGYFVLSPDGSRLAVVESGSAAVAVIDLASGASELVSGSHPGWKCRSLPSWKTNDELTFAALDPPTGTAQWVLWKEGGKELVSLSADWPSGATAGWLEYKRDTEPAAITPQTP